MNRRPQKSLSNYDAFSPKHASRFQAAAPDTRFFDVRKKRSPLSFALMTLLALLALSLCINFIANFFVCVERINIPITGLKEEFAGYTLLHISDLKGASFGGDQSRLTMALGDSQFDAVLFTGDMVSPLGNAQPFYDLIDALKTLRPQAAIYFIAGDNDPEPISMTHASSGSPFAPWVLGAQQRGAVLLSAPQQISRGNQSLWFCTSAQLSLDMDTMQPQYESFYLNALASGDENEIELAAYNLHHLENTRSARNAMTPSDVYVAITHAPPLQEELAGHAASQIDLLLCGHYLGGMMRLPFLGPLFIPSQSLPLYGLFPGDDMRCGLTRSGSTQIYVSPGLGAHEESYPPFFFRLFNPPTLTLLSLTPSAL